MPDEERAGPVADLPLEDQVALSLGRMMLRFAALEAIVRHTLHRVLDLEDDEHRHLIGLAASLPFRKVRDALLATAREQLGDSAELRHLKAILRQAAKVEERRNALTHSSWIYSDLPRSMTRAKQYVSASGALRDDAEAFRDVAELEAFVKEINGVAREVSRWFIGEYLGVHGPAA